MLLVVYVELGKLAALHFLLLRSVGWLLTCHQVLAPDKQRAEVKGLAMITGEGNEAIANRTLAAWCCLRLDRACIRRVAFSSTVVPRPRSFSGYASKPGLGHDDFVVRLVL